MDSIHILVLIGAYLVGSIPFGLILTRLAGTEDILSIGSKNIGATNVLRTGRKGLAALTLLLDAIKGYAAVMIAALITRDTNITLLAAALAMLGHMFPIWLSFKGGKGVATYVGVLFGLNLSFGLMFAGTWLTFFALWRISSLSAIAACVFVVIGGIFTPWQFGPVHWFIALASLLVIARHHANIKRLLKGEEKPFGKKE